MKMHVDYKWSIRQLEKDDRDECGAGIPLEALVHMGPVPAELRAPAKGLATTSALGTLGKLINLLRRRDHLSLEEVAEKAQVKLEELLLIERDEGYKPRPRTVVQLAEFFKLPANELSKIAGLKIAEDPTLEKAALKFAAHSEELTRLSKAERDALNEYLSVLTQRKK